MAVDDFNPDDLRSLASLVAADGGPEASVDLADLSLPGVWVTLSGLGAAQRLRGLAVRANLWCVAPDDSASTQLDDLAALFNHVKALVRAPGSGLEVTGEATAMPVQHPDGSILPAIQVPVRFHTVQTD